MKIIPKILLIALLFTATSLLANTLSDLNVKGFRGDESMQMKEKRSPFVYSRPAQDEILPHDLHLTGIAYNSGSSYALVSGYVLKLGDRIGGYRVIDIKTNQVTIKRLDESYVLKLGGGL